jgi:hypothetical protein
VHTCITIFIEKSTWLVTIDYICRVGSSKLVCASVVDPSHFGWDSDPRIRGSDQLFGIRLRILLFLSLTFTAPTKCLLLF